MHRQRVLAGAEPGEIDERGDVVGGDAIERVAAAAQREVDGRRHRLRLQVRAEVAQVHRLIAQRALERRRQDLRR